MIDGDTDIYEAWPERSAYEAHGNWLPPVPTKNTTDRKVI